MSSSQFSTNRNLEANRLTQELSSKATVEKYDYSLEDSEFASIPAQSQNISSDFLRSQVTLLCLNKLNKNGNFELTANQMKNCQAKALMNYSLYH